jgi:2-keto-3-deoxy-L-rhamnonate aldolase RhmA
MVHMLKDRIAARQLTIGSWITIGHPAIAEILARAGYEWLVVDLEHSMIDLDVAAELIRTIDLCGVSPLVRLTSNDRNQIKRVMDAGAHGIVVPMVNSAAEAAAAVAATRYAPAGTRGVGLSRAQGYGVSFARYLEWQHEGPIVVVQIEHIEAVERLDEILAVPGVDAFIVGPYDLSCSMGDPGEFERPEFLAAMARIVEAGARVGCPAGMHLVEPDPARLSRLVAEGYTFIAYSVDMRMLDVTARQGVSSLAGAPVLAS